jgi:hypothetical protein
VPLADLPGEAWAALGAVVSAGIGAVSAVVLERIRANRKLDIATAELSTQIEEVRRLARPTGNGFADEVRSALGDLRRTSEVTVAALGDVSRQVATLDARIWQIASDRPAAPPPPRPR